jgi:hypothetical protein
VVGSALLAVAVSLLATANGPGLTPDSVNYLSMARHLGRLQPMLGIGGTELTVFPPGYPFLLAAAELLGVPALTAARGIAAMSWGITVVCTAVAVHRRVPHRPWVAAGASAVVAVAAPLFAVMRMAWSEAPFVAVVMVMLVLADRCRQRGAATLPELAQLVALVWAATMLRYAGIVLILVGLVALWGQRRAQRCFVGAASVAPVLWLLRNVGVDGTLMGRRNPSTATFAGELGDLLATVGRWFVPSAAGGLLALVALAATVTMARSARGRSEPRPDLSVWATFLLSFLALTIWSRMRTQIDPLGDRLLAPAFAPLVVLLACALAPLLERSRTRSVAPRVLAGAVLGWVLVALVVPVGQLRADRAQGGSFLVAWFGDDELVDVVADLPDDVVLVSNQAEALAHLSGRPTVLDPPAHTDYGWTPADPSATRLISTVACSAAPVHLVWFDVTQPQYVAPDRLPWPLQVSTDAVVDGGRLLTVQLDPASRDDVTCERP